MADTVVNTAPAAAPVERDSGGFGFFLGVLLLLVVAFLVIYFGFGAIRGATSGTTVNVPKQVDVNVNGQKAY